MRSHEIDYFIHGNEMQFVSITLDPTESVVAEAGAFMMMDQGIHMSTVFGDGSEQGFFGKLVSAGKRLVTGESLFMTVFTNEGQGRQDVSFAAPYPGKIIAVDLKDVGNKLIAQKDSFLCAAKGVNIGIEFQRKIGVGFFGGEGFIMQKIEGDGLAFMHACGSIYERELQPGEVIRVDTGCIVAMTQDVSYDIQFVKGVKSMMFGGEGLFHATLKGPGKIWLQSLPFSRLADRIISASSISTGSRKEEGSVLGSIGNMIDGD